MKLGLITDVHEHVAHLRAALQCFADVSVDKIILLGDVFQMGEQLDETCRLLQEAGVEGVWGNHDFGLCTQPDPTALSAYNSATLDYMGTLRPRLTLADCHFSHVEPWLDAEDLFELWYFEPLPETPQQLERIFAASTQRVYFAGHCHRWFLATPSGVSDWAGDSRIHLKDDQYYVIIAALRDGRFATYDTESFELVPYDLGSAVP